MEGSVWKRPPRPRSTRPGSSQRSKIDRTGPLAMTAVIIVVVIFAAAALAHVAKHFGL
jgi:hypothetical protein